VPGARHRFFPFPDDALAVDVADAEAVGAGLGAADAASDWIP
jgi:hypothetical protein